METETAPRFFRRKSRGKKHPGVFVLDTDAVVDYFKVKEAFRGAGPYPDAGRFL